MLKIFNFAFAAFLCMLLIGCERREIHLLCKIQFTLKDRPSNFEPLVYHMYLDFNNPIIYYFNGRGSCDIQLELLKHRWVKSEDGLAYISKDYYICDAVSPNAIEKGVFPGSLYEINRHTGSVVVTDKLSKLKYFGSCKRTKDL